MLDRLAGIENAAVQSRSGHARGFHPRLIRNVEGDFASDLSGTRSSDSRETEIERERLASIPPTLERL